MNDQQLKTSPLNDRHEALGAKLAPFGGWNMPLSYPEGTLAEHRATRSAATVFDVSHLGTVRVEGPGAFDRLQAAFTNDLTKVSPGRAQYTHLLSEDGSVLDDIIVWWVDDQRFDVMPNASNTSDLLAALGSGDAGEADVGRFRVTTVTTDALGYRPVELVVAGTGYTGEDGVEIALPIDHAGVLWDRLIADGVAPAGLAARDTLRLEAGLPLHGSELGPGITPLNARLGWVVAWNKQAGFPGRQALETQRAAGASPLLWGLRTETRRPPRSGQEVRSIEDGSGSKVVGTVSSGNFSPELGVGIALAFLDTDIQPGDQVVIDQRGTDVPATVVKPPFLA